MPTLAVPEQAAKIKNMKTYRVAVFIAVLSAVILLVCWKARLVADTRHTNEVMRSLCKELQAYRQRTGQLPPNLGVLAGSQGLGAGWLSSLTNNVAVTYDPGSSNSMPFLSVNFGHAWHTVQGADFDYRD
jgi:hypothetical protein